MIILASLTMNEGEKANKDVHDGIYLTSVKNDKKLMKRIQIFLLQLQHFNANISCGLFRVDWKVMMMVSSKIVRF